MSFETFLSLYQDEQGTTLRPQGAGAAFSFHATAAEGKTYRLFTVGETEQYYMWKDEPDGPFQYRTITDALDTTHAIRDRYCLNFSSAQEEAYCKRAYKKILWPPVLSYLAMHDVPTSWQLGITVSGKNVAVAEDGFLQLRLDIRLRKEGVSRHSVNGPAEKSIVIPFPSGTYTGQRLCQTVEIPANTAHVGVFVEGKGYRGSVYVEQPTLFADEQNLLSPFGEPVSDKEKFDWTGQFLSCKEWPVFRVRLNGKTVYNGPVFERSHRHAEWEIALPAHLLQGENTIRYELLSRYHDPLPYTIYEIGLIEQPGDALSLLSVSHAAPVGGQARILVRTAQKNTRVTLTPLDPALGGGGTFLLKEKGLHGLCLSCLAPAAHATFRLCTSTTCCEGEVERIVERGEDQVITGSGDMIYICQKQEDMEEYLSWYLSNHVGNLITIRPAYRWSGTRTLDRPLWSWFARLMNELGMKYVLMVDGREVPGLAAQPGMEELAGEGFLGRQDHEYDGMEFYWPQHKIQSPTDEQAHDLMHFAVSEDPQHTSGRHSDSSYICKGETLYCYSDRDRPRDNAACREIVTSHLRSIQSPHATRHTGPACVFKYLYEGGYTWLGAETMYSTMEPLLGFLRGFAKEQGMQQWGVHHAVQWSSTPHGTPEHVRRFRLALYASYLLGATDINTEEGFWHMEEYYEHHHRFGTVCQAHLGAQQDFYRYVTTHTRSGSLHTPYAFLHGRDDGINFFCPDKTWGILAPQTVAEDSWQLVKAIYPQSVPGQAVYRHGCPTDRPVGYHTATPYGQADMLPVEGKEKTLSAYRTLIFLGYNHMTAEDAEKLRHCVESGSQLLMTRAHLSCTTSIEDVRCGNLTFAPCALAMTEGEPVFAPATYGGKPLSVCTNATTPDEVLLRTDEGLPLLCRYHMGAGDLLLFNTKEYPACDGLRTAYTEVMRSCIQNAIDEEPVWGQTGDDTEFAVYRQEDGSTHVYFLAVDWYRDPVPCRHAQLRIGQVCYDVAMPFGVLVKCVTDGQRAAWATSEEGEVLTLTEAGIRVQGSGQVTFCVAENGTIRQELVDFSASPIQTLPM